MTPKTLLRTLPLILSILLWAAPPARAAAGPEIAWQVIAPDGSKDSATRTAVDAQGNIYVTGDSTRSAWTTGIDGSTTGLGPGFVAKFSPVGQRLWSVGIGLGSYGKDIAVDSAGNVYVTGFSNSATNWAEGGYDETFGGMDDGFVVKISPAGQQLWSSYLGGYGRDEGLAVELDKNGNVLLTGKTDSTEWLQYDYRRSPAPNGYEAQVSYAFVVKLTPQGERLWSAALDSDELEAGHAIASDSAGNVCVAGVRDVTLDDDWGYEFPGLDSSQPFVAKLTPEGRPLWKIYLEGRTYQQAVYDPGTCGLAIDAADNLYLGSIVSRAWTVAGRSYDEDGCVTKLAPDGKQLWRTYLNRQIIQTLSDLAVRPDGDIYAAGVAVDYDLASAAWTGTYLRAFVTRLTPTGRQLWAYSFTAPKPLDELNMYDSASIAACGADEVVVYGTGGNYYGGYLAKLRNADQVPTGALSVAIAPPAAAAAGVQWRLAGEQAWRASGDVVTSAPAGLRGIEFKSAPYWAAPGSVAALVTAGQSVATSVTCTPGGALSVTLEPPQAVAEGARWRRAGSQEWLESGATEAAVTTGPCAIEFKPLANWSAPTSQTLVIRAGQTTSTLARYAIPQAEISWVDYLGGQSIDQATALATDRQGYIYVTGYTSSPGWCSGGFDDTLYVVNPNMVDTGNNIDAFAAKFTPQGDHLWSAYLGGSYTDLAQGIAVDGAGDVLIAGNAHNNPVSSYFAYSLGFLYKLSPEGQLRWNVTLGKTAYDSGTHVYGVAVDGANRIHLAGNTKATDLITTATKTGPIGGGYYDYDGFIASYSPDGRLLGGAIMGGLGDDSVQSIAVDREGNLCVAGQTAAPLSWCSGGYDVAAHGDFDAFVAKFTPGGQHLWSARLGGASTDKAADIAVDPANNLIIAGSTHSAGWVTGGYNTSFNGYDKGFAAKLTPDGKLLWSTYLGGSAGSTYANAVAVNGSGECYVAGSTSAAGWTHGGFDDTMSGANDGYLVKLTPNGQHAWSAYVGGDIGSRMAPEDCRDVALGADGQVYIAGAIASTDWVTGRAGLTFHALPNTLYQATDGFVAAIRETLPTAPRGAVTVALSPEAAVAAGAQWRRVGEANWRDALTTATNLPAGPAVIEFKATPGWRTPPSQRVTIADGQTTAVAAAYVRQTGALRIDLAPAQAVAAGAQWRRAGQTAWRDSGTTETGIATGSYPIEFKDVAGWNTPANALVTVAADKASTASAAYLTPSAQLRVSITPYEAVLLGARWRIAGESAWRNSGDTAAGITSSSVRIEFAPLKGWDAPTTQALTLTMNRINLLSGAYACVSGSLRVNIAPPEAVAAGAKWRRVGTSDWLAAGATEAGVPPPSAQVEFAPLVGWDAPTTQTAPIAIGQSNLTTGTYVRQYGSLSVTITPPAAASAGVQWRRAGTTVWLNSGATETALPGGIYAIEFRCPSSSNYYRTDSAAVAVGRGANAYALPVYLKTGSLTVTLSPSNVAATGAKWRRAGTTDWFASGATESGVPVGGWQIECSDVPDWRKPALISTSINVSYNMNTQFTLLYKRITGSLNVAIQPPEAVIAGAAWRRAGTTSWIPGGATETVVATGSYTVEFKPMSGWTPPPPCNVTVVDSKLTTASATFIRQVGALCVTLSPPEAVAAGAMWRRIGSTAWRASGTTETSVPSGAVTLEFKPAPKWKAPAAATAYVSINQTKQAGFVYLRDYNAIRSELWTKY